ncbi:MAG TPA: C4-type zinc ribbon domain-containing protein [Marmoricola sp.]|nr:C4-type zinc ribbon domain-containing protein [Marmoricola sp.]
MDLPGRHPRGPTLKADPFAQLKLLDVQELDTRLDTLRHQLEHIPETATLQDLARRRREVDDAVRDLRIQVTDLTAEQRKADADVEQVKARKVRDQGMLDSGSVADPKALERMLGEMQSLDRRISDLEDVELEVMERLETAQAQLDERTAELARLDEEVVEVQAERDRKAGGLHDQVAAVTAERKQSVAGMPEDLLSLYEKLRAQKGGVGAAPLRARECGGCRLTLDPSILSEIARRPTDDVVRCEECSRILVRTSESGI